MLGASGPPKTVWKEVKAVWKGELLCAKEATRYRTRSAEDWTDDIGNLQIPFAV